MTDLANQMHELYTAFGDLPGITIELHKQLLAVRVDNRQASATVFLQGAQLTQFTTKDDADLLWCSEQCEYREGVPIRGGIPICWPWFGSLLGNNAAVVAHIPSDASDASTSHGFVRNRMWQLSDVEIIDDNKTQLLLTLSIAEGEEKAWPYATELALKIGISDSLSVELIIHNVSSQRVAFSSALHSYFPVDDISAVEVFGLHTRPYIDCIDDWREATQEGSVIVESEVDRIYYDCDEIITLTDSCRQISVESTGSRSTVVWNPWIEKSKRLSQFSEDDYKRMICIETANVGPDYVTLEPNEKHSLAIDLSEGKK